MECNAELISAFLDGELDTVIYKKVVDHLLECDRCCRTLANLAMVRDALQEGFSLADPEEMTASIMTAVTNDPSAGSFGIAGGSVGQQLQMKLVRYGLPAAIAAGIISTLAQNGFS
ncbi:anti-sigma factor family protein [Magnetococcales bacterium HHB-1]